MFVPFSSTASSVPAMSSDEIAQKVVEGLLVSLRDNPLPLLPPEPPRQTDCTGLADQDPEPSEADRDVTTSRPLQGDEEDDIEEEIQSQMSKELQNYSRHGASHSAPRRKRNNMADLHSIFKNPSIFGRFVASYGRATGYCEFSFQLPSWISLKIYEMKYASSYAGWDISLISWSIVHSTSEVFLRVAASDAEGLQQMFRNGTASPYDRDEEGHSLLQVRVIVTPLFTSRLIARQRAVLWEAYDVCNMLLQMGFVNELDEAVGKSKRQVNRPCDDAPLLTLSQER